ncbi:MAG: hypothetical protein IKI76_01175 [Selenomonadaceae bacterium]|nr:hypothetical protein [Selenomonadaceae bacterium]
MAVRPSYVVRLEVLRGLIAGYGSQRKVARQAGVSWNCMLRVLRVGRAYPKTIIKLSRLFKVPAEELVCGECPPLRRKYKSTSVRIKRGKLLGAILDVAESIAEFNRRIGMCQSTLYRILKRRRTKIKTLERICAGLNRPAEDFIEEVDL